MGRTGANPLNDPARGGNCVAVGRYRQAGERVVGYASAGMSGGASTVCARSGRLTPSARADEQTRSVHTAAEPDAVTVGGTWTHGTRTERRGAT